MADEHHTTTRRSTAPPRRGRGPAGEARLRGGVLRRADKPDAIAVVDIDPGSARYGTVVGYTELPNRGDELHHFGWNACSSALHPSGGHNHGDRRYLVVPGIRSSRINILDIEPEPAAPTVVKVLDGPEVGKRASYSRPHIRALRPRRRVRVLPGRLRRGGPGGVALLDQDNFDVLGHGRTTAATSTSPMTCGGTSTTTSPSPRSGAPRP